MKRSIKNQDPSRQKGNARTTLMLVVALAAGGVAVASRDSEPKEPKITFESNAQAQARLQDLARVYGSGEKISSSEKRDINAALEGSIPIFKEDAAQRARQIMAADSSGKPKNAKVVQNDITRAYHAAHSVNATNGEEVFRITTSRSRQGAGSTTSQSMTITQGPNGTQIQFTTENFLPSIPGLSASSNRAVLNIDSDNKLDLTVSEDRDANAATYEYGSGVAPHFSFDGQLHAGVLGVGRGLTETAKIFAQADAMLSESISALAATSNPS